ncbi:DUF4167 domain-containing protein [Qipengyuania xiapuensis]|uniref:DUF4167 domain-containing protein n=1 Tax=Qipengyuania xiapuensis TaxID=2867236 RepID=A0ABX8ZW25_9SPHN|nr:DUF4167 domain-containing protein [Qipengyuania xiapuensis]QZD91792.1 DUF4167 domain-containing protein [Qipengyuania xiapuensis]
MNSNRNNRRRGRNNNRNQGGGNSANRIDSRARGNAPQLLDKYKKLAQDAQHNGDRVQAEYYLQFADHYFRVIADNKARQEEAKAKRNDDRGQNQSDDDDSDDDGDDRRKGRKARGRRDDDQGQQDGRGRKPRRSSNDDDGDEFEPVDNPFTRKDDEDEAPKKRRAPRKAKKGEEGVPGNEGEIDASALPPAIGTDDDKPAPRRRSRKPAEDEDVSAVG